MPRGKIIGVNGPVVRIALESAGDFSVGEQVRVGTRGLLGEVIALRRTPKSTTIALDHASGVSINTQPHVSDDSVVTKPHASDVSVNAQSQMLDVSVVQVYEDTAGLRVGETVHGTGQALSVRIAPGWVGHIFDGTGRRLDADESSTTGEKWPVHITVKPGDTLTGSAVWAEVAETPSITYKTLLPPGISGVVKSCVPDGLYTCDEPLLTIEPGTINRANKTNKLLLTPEITNALSSVNMASFSLAHAWPVRTPRPVRRRLPLSQLLITGQRVIDSLFPIAKGGAGALPGGFGTGKTMTQHQLAKWCDADLIVYIGCGERGNEMAQTLEDFSRLRDPRTGETLMARTILIANTSDMPVAAREASIYTGLAVAEAYRDMGLHVAVMADSTSRWAEAARELSVRLEEMPPRRRLPRRSCRAAGGFLRTCGLYAEPERFPWLHYVNRRGFPPGRGFY